MDMERDVFQRLRLAVDDAQIVDFEKRGVRVAERGFRPRGRLERAAEIDLAHCRVRHHLLDCALGDPLADMHGVNPVDQRGNAFHVVVDDQDRPAVGAHLGDQRRERRGLARRQAGERLVDQHHLRIAGDRLGDLHFAQVRERQGRRAPVKHAGQSDTLGDRPRPSVGGGAGQHVQQSVGQKAENDVLDDRLPVERPRVLEHHAHAEPGDPVRRPARDLPAVDPHRAGVRPLDPQDRFHHR